jgi:hypothetical protein
LFEDFLKILLSIMIRVFAIKQRATARRSCHAGLRDRDAIIRRSQARQSVHVARGQRIAPMPPSPLSTSSIVTN